jgi:hypothetical protein
MKRIHLASLALLVSLGCVAHERVVVHEQTRPPPPCERAMWADGHYGPHGNWHAGHWRCPGTVEVIEVD